MPLDCLVDQYRCCKIAQTSVGLRRKAGNGAAALLSVPSGMMREVMQRERAVEEAS